MSGSTPALTIANAAQLAVGARVTLGGVPLAGEGVRWIFADGAVSPEVELVVDNEVDAKLAQIDDEVTLDVETLRVGAQADRLTVKRLLLWRRQPLDPWRVRWTLRDRRALLEDVRVSASFNVVRGVGERDVLGDQPAPIAAINTVAKLKYLSHTTRIPGTTEFSPPIYATDDGAQVEVWTAKAIVLWLLGPAIGHALQPQLRDESGVDAGIVVQNQVHEHEPWPAVLDRYLGIARLGLYVDADGVFVLYDRAKPQPPLILPELGAQEGGQVPAAVDLSRARPDTVVAYVPREHELLVEFVEDTSSTVARVQSDPDQMLRRVENVVQLPTPLVVAGRQRQAGEFVEVQDFIDACNAAGWPSGSSLSLERLRHGLFNGMLIYDLISSSGAFPAQHPREVAWISALVASYRTLFRLSPVLVEAAEWWAPIRTSLPDPVTRQPPIAPVWVDHHLVPVYQPDREGADQNDVFTHSYPHPLSPGGSGRLDDSTASTFFRVDVVSREAGVFRVVPVQDLAGEVLQVKHSRLENDLPINPATGSVGYYELGVVARDHRMSALITVRLGAPNGSRRRYYQVYSSASDAGQTAKRFRLYEFPIEEEPARFRWDYDNSRGEFTPDGQIEITGSQLLNAATLQSVVQGKLHQMWTGYADRVVGELRRPGFNPAEDRPRGNVRSVTVQFSPNGRLESVHLFADAYPAPDLRQLLDAATRRVIYRELSRGGR